MKEVRALKLGLAFNLLFFLIEFLLFFTANSVAVLGDSLHNLSHAAVLIFSIWGIQKAQEKFLKIYVPAFNAVFLVLVAGGLLWQGAQRLIGPEDVAGLPIVIIACLDITANIIVAFFIRKQWRALAFQSILFHLLTDAFASLGVLIAGTAIMLWEFYFADGIAAIVIGAGAAGMACYLFYQIRKQTPLFG